jgi:hypothetical protein
MKRASDRAFGPATARDVRENRIAPVTLGKLRPERLPGVASPDSTAMQKAVLAPLERLNNR